MYQHTGCRYNSCCCTYVSQIAIRYLWVHIQLTVLRSFEPFISGLRRDSQHNFSPIVNNGGTRVPEMLLLTKLWLVMLENIANRDALIDVVFRASLSTWWLDTSDCFECKFSRQEWVTTTTVRMHWLVRTGCIIWASLTLPSYVQHWEPSSGSS